VDIASVEGSSPYLNQPLLQEHLLYQWRYY